MFQTSLSPNFKKRVLLLALAGAVLVPLAACDLTKNQLKIDRAGDMEMQDYRDALAPRLPDIDDGAGHDAAGIPPLRDYMATPSDTLKPMPLVTLSVNQSVPLRDVLYELAQQADYDLELDPRIRGSIIFSARNRPFDQVVERIAESAGLRYKFDTDSVKVELDSPYHEIYKLNYLNYVRSNTSSITNDVAVVSGEGTDTGSRFSAESTSEADFWGEIQTNLDQIMAATNNASALRTSRDPSITAVAQIPAPVVPIEPVVLRSDGEIGEARVEVRPADTMLQVQPLAADDEEESRRDPNAPDPFAGRYSVNRQAGIISVYASERTHKQIARYLDELRKSVSSQVLIEAKVLEVSLNDEYAAGIDWSAVNLFNNRLTFGVTGTSGNPLPNFATPASPSLGLLANYASNDFNAAVEAMSRFGTVRALASPRLTVLNNQSAVLNVARNVVYFELQVQRTTIEGGSVDTNIDSSIRNVPEGVLINVQPSIDLDTNTISMAVRPTVTRIESYVNDPAVSFISGGDVESPVPVVNVQEFDSIIRMNNGQPLVMGGLIQDRSTSSQTGVPVLSEVPVVGGLFRNQSDRIEKTELVVFLKATIVEGGNNASRTDKDIYRTFSQDRQPLRF